MWNLENKHDLNQAVQCLENTNFIANAMSILGSSLEDGLQKLPSEVQKQLGKAVYLSLDCALDTALLTMQEGKQQKSSNWLHKGLVAATGAAGGAFGFSGMAVELPVTTGIMLRSIADIARSEGEDIRSADCSMACLQVFSFGSSKSKNDDDADVGYYAVRGALSGAMAQAVSYLNSGCTVSATAPVLVSFIAKIASRFDIVVTEKALLQAIPIIGAASGAIINTAFISHYQNMARGHFIIRRLERQYGAIEVQDQYMMISNRK